MALTRAFLKGLGLTDDQMSAIIEAHTDTVDGIKKDRDKYKADAEKLPEVQKELDELKAGSDDWKGKYEKEHKAFDDYKKDVSDKETRAKIKAAYRKLLKDANVGENHHDSILKVTDFSTMKLNEDGTLSDSDKLNETIKKDWSGFITSKDTRGAGPETPPGGKKTESLGRAAQLANQYHNGLFGKNKEE